MQSSSNYYNIVQLFFSSQTFPAMRKKELILALLKDDLINSKLVFSLGNIGLCADDYLLHTSETVFKLMGFPEDKNSEEFTAQYVTLTERVKKINTEEWHYRLDGLAYEIYTELRALKVKRSMKKARTQPP